MSHSCASVGRTLRVVSAAFVLGMLVSPEPVAAQSNSAVGAVGVDGLSAPVPSEVVTRDGAGHVLMRAVRLTRPLNLDGRLTDEVYASVAPVGDFVQQEPNEGAPATEKTDVWVFFDDSNIYVAARCWDSQPDKIIATEMRRDNQNIQDDDSFTVLLDTFYDRRNGYFMQTNTLGALRDQQISDERNANRDWNTVWDTKVQRDDMGYTVEMVIPFKSLRYTTTGAQTWGVNFRRIVSWKNEVSFLSGVPASLGVRGAYRFSQAATLVGIVLTGQSRNFELKPFATSAMITNHQSVPALSNDLDGKVGLDGKYGLTKGLTADFTVNTDFSQVEDDEQQVNFTRFSLFYPEKREFFLEGQGIFAFGGVNPRPPGGDGNGNFPANNSAPPLTPVMFFSRQIGISNKQEVPIRAGARVSGRTGPYTLGLLNIQTAASEPAAAVATNFSVIRVRRDILRRSTIGLIGTYRPQRALGAPGSNEVLGADATLSFFQNLTLNTYYARSQTPGVTAGDSSYLAKVDYTGDRYGLSAERLSVGEGFKPEIGFMRRTAFQRTFGLARFSPRPQASPTIRKLIFEGRIDYIADPTGRLETRDAQGTFQIDLQSGDQWQNEVVSSYEFLVDLFLVEGVVVEPGGYDFLEFRTTYYFAPQHWLAGRATFASGSFYGGDKTEAGYTGRLDLGSRISLEPRVSISCGELPGGRFTTKLISVRPGFSMSPRMAVTGLIQYNSSSASLTSNVRFRWEYQPGSDLFVVYSDGRDTQLSGAPILQNRTLAIKATRLFRW